MSTRSAVVIGSSLAGLFTATSLSQQGFRVIVLERDEMPTGPAARRGVPQGTQVHVLLERGHRATEALLPGLRDDLVRHGAARFDGGRMPWLGEHGWVDTGIDGFEIVSVTRPLLEQLVRERVLALPGVTLVEDARVAGLSRVAAGWRVRTTDDAYEADIVVDASGRSSRLSSWLVGLGAEVAEPEIVDAQFGYACRLYRARSPLPVRTGIVIGNTPGTSRGALAMPVEDGHWLLMAGGNATQRPERDVASFEGFFDELRDPALSELVDLLEPVSEVYIHRQTQNRRFAYGQEADWPEGLVALGDSLCAFNPVYGQGITVAACQAELLGHWLAGGKAVNARLQRRLAEVAAVPWGMATAEDRRQPASGYTPTPVERVTIGWTQQLGRMVASGDRAATLWFSTVYNLMAPPTMLLHPVLLARAARSVLRPRRTLARPACLVALSRHHQALRPGRVREDRAAA